MKFSTISDLEIKEVYTADDLKNVDLEHDLGRAGEYPYTRGIHETMYRGKPWTIRLFSGFGTAHETNRRYQLLLEQGQHGLSVAFDMPTLMGIDSDDPRSLGEVGKCGVAIDTLQDMEILFQGIPLDQVTTSMTINGPAMVLLAMYFVVAEKQGVALSKVGGTIQNDILKEYIAQKEWIYPPRPSMRIIQDMMVFCTRDVPKWNTISISGYHIREAGSTAAQELAFTLADGIGYVQAGIEAGLDVDEFAPRLSFFFNAHSDFFEEIAKYRAARRLWAKIMRERFHAKDPRSWKLRFHTQTAGCSLTAQQPYNNIVRTAIQALSGVLGGTQSLHTNSLDETLALPTEFSARVALRTQQIIAEETGVVNAVDPLGGSFFVESLTNTLEQEAKTLIEKIDEMGGIIAAIEKNFPQQEIARAAYHYQKQLEQKEKIIVGVNKYVQTEEESIETLYIDEAIQKKQVAALKKIKQERQDASVREVLEQMKQAARGKQNLMPLMMEAVRRYATLGEMCEALKTVFGGYTEKAVI
ncbi:MAG: methylmalonyl-CoA mutase family protein [Deltaproteobacteria bacterium]|nr:methylmalonyl-CoA mutase family protein [Deltaproteobacteria bacterium]